MGPGRAPHHQPNEPVAGGARRLRGGPRVGAGPHVRETDVLTLQAGDQVSHLIKQFSVKRLNIDSFI